MNIQKVTIIGAGNLGSQLGRAMADRGLSIEQVFSRSIEKAQGLALAVGAAYTPFLEDITGGADLYMLAVRDDAIESVARALSKNLPPSSLLVHTSGARASTVLEPFFERYGIFYPLQTISRGRPLAVDKVPFCIHANKEAEAEALMAMASRLSGSVHRMEDAERAYLHMAAVFANNFPNHLFAIAHRLLERRGLDFDLLRPLIEETAAKVMDGPPADLQTGPAIRGDANTLQIHLDLLDDEPEIQQLYLQLTRSIAPDLNL